MLFLNEVARVGKSVQVPAAKFDARFFGGRLYFCWHGGDMNSTGLRSFVLRDYPRDMFSMRLVHIIMSFVLVALVIIYGSFTPRGGGGHVPIAWCHASFRGSDPGMSEGGVLMTSCTP